MTPGAQPSGSCKCFQRVWGGLDGAWTRCAHLVPWAKGPLSAGGPGAHVIFFSGLILQSWEEVFLSFPRGPRTLVPVFHVALRAGRPVGSKNFPGPTWSNPPGGCLGSRSHRPRVGAALAEGVGDSGQVAEPLRVSCPPLQVGVARPAPVKDRIEGGQGCHLKTLRRQEPPPPASLGGDEPSGTPSPRAPP